MAVLKYLSGTREHISAVWVFMFTFITFFFFFTRPDVPAKGREFLSIFRGSNLGSNLPSSRATRVLGVHRVERLSERKCPVRCLRTEQEFIKMPPALYFVRSVIFPLYLFFCAQHLHPRSLRNEEHIRHDVQVFRYLALRM